MNNLPLKRPVQKIVLLTQALPYISYSFTVCLDLSKRILIRGTEAYGSPVALEAFLSVSGLLVGMV